MRSQAVHRCYLISADAAVTWQQRVRTGECICDKDTIPGLLVHRLGQVQRHRTEDAPADPAVLEFLPRRDLICFWFSLKSFPYLLRARLCLPSLRQ